VRPGGLALEGGVAVAQTAPLQVRDDPAGKGINVSAALINLGFLSICLGFNYNDNGHVIEGFLNGLGIPHSFINVPGAVRTNIKVLERDTQTMTEINTYGTYVPPGSVDLLLESISMPEIELLVLSGGYPRGVDEDIYRRIIEGADAPVILDATGESLLLGLQASRNKPFMVKPNLQELESTFNKKFGTHIEIVDFCRRAIIMEYGVKMVCTSLDKDGAILVGEREAYYAPGLPLVVRGAQGAGDSLVAGFVYGLMQTVMPGKRFSLPNDIPYKEFLRCAIAAASASVIREGTLMCTKKDFDMMQNRVIVEPLG